MKKSITKTAPKPARPKKSKKAADDGLERLHKRIATSGLCSRRAAEQMILEGRVEVNGAHITEMGVKVGPDDEVRVDGKVVGVAKLFTLVMNKPVGYVTTLSDPQGRPTVARLLPDLGVMMKPVGRLDMDSEGLLLFSNDGALAQRLTHPRFGVEKEYQVTVQGKPAEKDLEHLRKGIWIPEGGKTAPAKVVVTHTAKDDASTVIKMTIHEGRKRQIRLMFEGINHPVIALKRIRIGPLTLYKMRPGECRMVSQQELEELKKSVGL